MSSDADLAAPSEILGTARQHATANVPVARPSDDVDAVLTALRGRKYDEASVVAVVDGGRLLGVATIERLLAAGPTATLAEVMDADPPTVAPGTDQEDAAWRAFEHGEPGLAVVDEDGRFVGLISPQRLLGVLLGDHDEDVARIGGFLADSEDARSASTAPLVRRLRQRLPWLLVGFAGALVSALVVGAFESGLEEEVLVAFFVPGVVYLADAVGAQTVAVVVRGLSIGVSVRRTAALELVTGVIVGAVLALVAVPTVYVVWGDLAVAGTVGVALFAASSFATIIATVLPAVIHRMGKDPAYGAGPLSTVIQDLLSLVVYFVAASIIVF
jgi:magnesium transporter